MNRAALQNMLNCASAIALLLDGGVGEDMLCEMQNDDLRAALTSAGLVEHPDAWAGVVTVCGMLVHDSMPSLKEARDQGDDALFLHIATSMAMHAGAAIAAGRMIGLHPVLPTASGQVQAPGATGEGGDAPGTAGERAGCTPESQAQGRRP